MVISVPSSGTRFLAALLGHADTYYHTYLFEDPEQVRVRDDGVIAAPLRRPEDVWRTWWQRFGHRRPDRMDPDHPRSIETAWRRMDMIASELDVLFLPIDLPIREQQLQLLSERVGRELKTDWLPVGNRPPEEKTAVPPEKDWSWVYELSFMKTFYADR